MTMLTDVYILFLHFCLHLHMRSVMLPINEYDDNFLPSVCLHYLDVSLFHTSSCSFFSTSCAAYPVQACLCGKSVSVFFLPFSSCRHLSLALNISCLLGSIAMRSLCLFSLVLAFLSCFSANFFSTSTASTSSETAPTVLPLLALRLLYFALDLCYLPCV